MSQDDSNENRRTSTGRRSPPTERDARRDEIADRDVVVPIGRARRPAPRGPQPPDDDPGPAAA